MKKYHVRIIYLRKVLLNMIIDAVSGTLDLPAAMALMVAIGEEWIHLSVVVRLRAHVIDIVAEVGERHVERCAVAVTTHGLRPVRNRVAERHDAQHGIVRRAAERGKGRHCEQKPNKAETTLPS